MTALPETPAPFLTVEDYLEGEAQSEVRHEYFGGAVVAMAGESVPHNLIAGAIYIALRAKLGSGPCQVFMSGVKLHVRVADEDVFYYPDVMVACDPRDRHPYYRNFPKLVLEVLSPSTEQKDRVEKYLAYQRIESLEEYVLVGQDVTAPRVTVFRRRTDWRPEVLTEGELHLESLGLSLKVSEIYAS